MCGWLRACRVAPIAAAISPDARCEPKVEQTLEGVVDAVGEIARAQFPELSFLDPNGVLELSCNLPSVVCLRLELPGTECLHLGQVLIDIDGPVHLVSEAELAASSTWRGYGKHLAEGHVIDPLFRGTGFHTKKEHRPWLEVRFREPVDIQRIRLRNRDNSTARRARGLRVMVRTDAGRWCTVHDGMDREQQFALRTAQVHGSLEDVTGEDGSSPAPASVGGDLARIVTQLHLREYEASLVRDLRLVQFSEEDRGRLRELVNARILHDRELEWTSHGVRRSFRFWSQEEKEEYVAFAMSVVEDLRSLTESVSLGFGSVLAIVRDNDLIPHDDDLDIIIGFEPSKAATIAVGLQLIETALRNAGYVVSGTNTAHRMVSRPGVKKVDVFVGIFEGDEISWYPGHRGALSREIVFPGTEVNFMGVDCAMPADPPGYLAAVYGPDWSTPDPHFKHSGDRKEYAHLIR